MKKFALSMLICSAIATAQADELVYDAYQILGMSDLKDQNFKITFVITSNPSMGLMLDSVGPEAAKRLRRGELSGCKEVLGDELDRFIDGAQSANMNAAQLLAIHQLSGTPLTEKTRKQLEILKNLALFGQESSGLPIYRCLTNSH